MGAVAVSLGAALVTGSSQQFPQLPQGRGTVRVTRCPQDGKEEGPCGQGR